MSVFSKDDHAVKTVKLYVDGALKATTQCDNVTYICDAHYTWPTSRGQHSATYVATDWMGNEASASANFTVK